MANKRPIPDYLSMVEPLSERLFDSLKTMIKAMSIPDMGARPSVETFCFGSQGGWGNLTQTVFNFYPISHFSKIYYRFFPVVCVVMLRHSHVSSRDACRFPCATKNKAWGSFFRSQGGGFIHFFTLPCTQTQ